MPSLGLNVIKVAIGTRHYQLNPTHLYDAADAEEKRSVGKVWESRSRGRCLFVMPTEGDFSTITQAVKLNLPG